MEIHAKFPHWGRIWGVALKITKYNLNRLVGSYQLTFEKLSMVLCQIEAHMNSRALCSLSNDPLDFHCLIPGHFLIGFGLTAFPDKNLIDVPGNRLKFWEKLFPVVVEVMEKRVCRLPQSLTGCTPQRI